MHRTNAQFAKRYIDFITNLVIACTGLLILWIVGKVFVFATFTIPTDSMTPDLQPDDQVVVWKMESGVRLFNLSKALDHRHFTIHRIPGFRNIKRTDILVFNFPYPHTWDSIAFDISLYYAKRCVALPGDTFEIKQGLFHVRNTKDNVGNMLSQRKVNTMWKTYQGKMRLKQMTHIKAYPLDSPIGWTIGNFGPLYVPKKGDSILLDSHSYELYKRQIAWETQQPVSLQGEEVSIGGNRERVYTFQHNYYFVAGDNCLNSKDSRYWGLLPDDYIVGIAHKV